jgi:hypothetical protein
VSVEYSKRITDNFGVSIGSTWTHLALPGIPSQSGFQNLETTFKYQFLTLAEHEFVMSGALVAEWGNTGAARSTRLSICFRSAGAIQRLMPRARIQRTTLSIANWPNII